MGMRTRARLVGVSAVLWTGCFYGGGDSERSLDAGYDGPWTADANVRSHDASVDATVTGHVGDAATDASVMVDAAPQDAGAAPNDGWVQPNDAGQSCTLTYANYGKRFVDTYCISCHTETIVGTLADIQSEKLAIESAVVVYKTMPAGNDVPTDAERATFAQWLDCGPI